jgi:hypothetical protein
MMKKEEFIEMLKAHDWYYMYSDDHSVYCKGRDEITAIFEAMKENPEFGKLYEEYEK